MYNFNDKNLRTYSPVILGDIVNILDYYDSSFCNPFVTFYLGDWPYAMPYATSVAEFIARFLNVAYEEFYKSMPKSPKSLIKNRIGMYNYITGLFDILVYFNYLKPTFYRKLLNYIINDFWFYLLEDKYKALDVETANINLIKFEEE